MVKEKRKSRLDKLSGSSSGTEFIGFSAFAAPQQQDNNSSSKLVWTPVYTGGQERLQLIFPRIHQKKDSTTKVKGIQELQAVLLDDALQKRVQIEAIQHWAWLYHSKLFYDGSATVRAEALRTWNMAQDRLPKAVSTLVASSQEAELLGMFFATRVDLSAEVRTVAEASCNGQLLYLREEWPWNTGILTFHNRILSYGRPGAMYDALFAKKNESHSSMNEQQRDAIEERFERLVGMSLESLALWLKDGRAVSDIAADQTVMWWKYLSSPKTSLRRKSYTLVAVVSSVESALLPSSTDQILSQALLSEKETVNLPTLLETVLSFIANTNYNKVEATFGKPLSKLLKKACFGAKVDAWGPTLLPLTASFPDPCVLLKATWDGKELTLGGVDRFHLFAAMLESTTYALVRNPDANHPLPETSARELALLWSKIFHGMLSGTATGPSEQARVVVIQDAAKQVYQLQDAVLKRPACAFASLHDWFWRDIISLERCDPIALATLLEQMTKLRGNKQETLPFRVQLKLRFMDVLKEYQGSSGAVPTRDAYRFFQAALEIVSPDRILETQLNKFVMNDLLRWIILHTSRLSDHAQTEDLIRYDFSLLMASVSCVADKALLWDQIVKEIVKANCDLDLLRTGLDVVVSSGTSIFCNSLNVFALNLATTLKGEDGTGNQLVLDESLVSFFRFLLRVKLHSPVLEGWLEALCEEKAVPELVDALQFAVNAGNLALSLEFVCSLLLEAWRINSTTFECYCTKYLQLTPEVCIAFVEKASATFKDAVQTLHLDVEKHLSMCSLLGWRLLEVCSASDAIPNPSLRHVGMEDIEVWRSYPRSAFALAFSLLCKYHVPQERLELFRRSSNDYLDMLGEILISLSEGNISLLKAGMARNRKDRCFQLLAILGGQSLDKEVLGGLVAMVVSKLESALESIETEFIYTAKATAVLSQLVSLLFRPLKVEAQTLIPEDLKEGDEVKYITNIRDSGDTESARIVKIHYDSQAGYYFSILVSRDGNLVERQTVLERIRKHDHPDRLLTEDSIPVQEEAKRSAIRHRLMNPLSKFFRPGMPNWILGDIVNILVNQVGVGSDRGIGSVHYDIFKLLQSHLAAACYAIGENDSAGAVNVLLSCSLAVGFGLNVPCSSNPVSIDTAGLRGAITELYQCDRESRSVELNSAVLMCLSSLVIDQGGEEKGDYKTESCLRLMFDLAAQCLAEQDTVSSDHTVIACCAIRQGLLLFLDRPSSVDDSCIIGALRVLLKSFGKEWPEIGLPEDQFGDGVLRVVRLDPFWIEFTAFPGIIQLIQGQELLRNLAVAASAAPDVLGHICSALFSRYKRFFAWCLLENLSKHSHLFQEKEGEVMLCTETSDRLKEWQSDIGEEEAAELEEDVHIVAEWVPSQIMKEIETWAEEGIDDYDEETTYGQLLTWLVFLSIVDSAAPKDSRNRPAFVSYLTKCGAVSHILNLSLLNHESIHERKQKLNTMDSTLDDSWNTIDSLTSEKLASRVLFRTVEALPSLARRWWEEDCPKVFTSPVQTYLEKQIAPQILKRELRRIKASTVFGDMSVSANLVAREVTATYVQDDFTLTVQITLPASFPLRSAEVDCSKTLGVPLSRSNRWSLQITLMLNNQGGTLQDALVLWKDNVDKEFEGVEPCPVCYSVLHVKTHKLPSLECNTCHNRFHVECLTQWFRSSGKSQCVLCQTRWQGTRV